MRKLTIAFLLIWSGSSVCCAQPSGMNEYESIKRIPNSVEQDRRDAFDNYPTERQIDIYLYSQWFVQGGDQEFFRFMVAGGKSKLPALVERLGVSESTDFHSTVGLIQMIDAIDNQCRCLSANPDAYSIISRKELQVEASDIEGVKDFKRLYSKIRLRIEARKELTVR